MPDGNLITITDAGGRPDHDDNDIKIVFSGDTRPYLTDENGATIDDNDRIQQNKAGDWYYRGQVNGGSDSIRYFGARKRAVAQYPGGLTVSVNNGRPEESRRFGFVPWEHVPGESRGDSPPPAPDPDPGPGPGPGPIAPDAGHSGHVGWRPQSRTSGQKKRHDIEFERVLHAVDDLGWEPDRKGRGPVNDLPTDDGTLVEVPDGEWVLGRNPLTNPKNWGVIGLGEDVTLRAPNSRCVRMVQISANHPGENILLENLTFDQRDGLQAGVELRLNVTDKLHVENCRRVGRTPNRDTAGPPFDEEPNGLTLAVRDPRGEALITHWTDHCQTRVVDYPKNAQGIFAGLSSKGTIRLENSTIKNQGEHAIYASKAENVRIENCELFDCVNTNCRIAGAGSWAKHTTIGYSRERRYSREHDTGDLKATKGLRMEHSRGHGVTGGRFENCRFVWKTEGLAAPVLAYVMGNVGDVDFTECVFHNDTAAPTVKIDAEGSGWRGLSIPGNDEIRFLRCRFEGDGTGRSIDNRRPDAVTLLQCDDDRPNAKPSRGV